MSIVRIRDTQLDVLSPALDEGRTEEAYTDVLRAFVQDTYEVCTFHRKRLDRAGVPPSSIKDFGDFTKLPLLGPLDVSSTSPLNLLPDRFRSALQHGTLADLQPGEQIIRSFMTSSSTGQPKISYYTLDDWAVNCAMMERLNAGVPRQHFARAFNCFHPGHFGGKNIEDGLGRFGSLVHARHFTYTSQEEVLAQLTSQLRDLGGFTCLAVPPTRPAGSPEKGVTLDALLNLDVDNYIGKNIRVLIAGGAPFNVPGLRLRERVREANDLAGAPPTRILERYGGSEVGLVATTCSRGAMHLVPGPVLTEIVDEKTGKQVKNGERGLVTFTGLRQGSRFLRYLVGDEARFVTDLCPCNERVTPRLEEIRRVLEPERLRGGCAAGGI